jgi:hypothetical protein
MSRVQRNNDASLLAQGCAAAACRSSSAGACSRPGMALIPASRSLLIMAKRAPCAGLSGQATGMLWGRR